MIDSTTISDRIAKMISYLQISTNEFALRLGYSRSQFLYDVLKQKSKPSYTFFEKLATSEYGNVFSLEWLITGKGEYLKNYESINFAQLLAENQNVRSIIETQKSLIELQNKEIKRLESLLNKVQ